MSEKPHIGIVFIGHVDHGKSTLTGRLLYESGQIDQYTIKTHMKEAAKMGKSKVEFAWVMDSLMTERERGLSIIPHIIDVHTEKYSFTITDAPGHERFVKNMILGIRQADAAILVVSAKESEGIQEQTREHVYLMKTFGINQVIVVINKMDITEPAYSKVRYVELVKSVGELMKIAGFKEQEYEFVPTSAYEGDNVLKPSRNLKWYPGDTFFKMLDTFRPPKRLAHLPLRWPIQRVAKVPGIGSIPVGTVETGVIRPKDTIVFMPSNRKAKVKTIEMHRKRIERGIPGDIIGADVRTSRGWSVKRDLRRGEVAGLLNSPPTVAEKFTAQITIFDPREIFPDREKRFAPSRIEVGFTPLIHCHTAQIPCRMVKLLKKFDVVTGDVIEREPKYVRGGDSAEVIFKPIRPFVIEKKSEFPRLSQFAIRHAGKTIGAGICIDMEEKRFQT